MYNENSNHVKCYLFTENRRRITIFRFVNLSVYIYIYMDEAFISLTFKHCIRVYRTVPHFILLARKIFKVTLSYEKFL